MIISEKGLCAAMKRALGGGYNVLSDGMGIRIFTQEWGIETDLDSLPRKALALLVEHTGAMPMGSFQVFKGDGDIMVQLVKPEIQEERAQAMERGGQERFCKFTNLRYGGRCLYQDRAGRIVAISPMAHGMIENGAGDPVAVGDKGMIWQDSEGRVIAAAERPEEPGHLWEHLEQVQWSPWRD